MKLVVLLFLALSSSALADDWEALKQTGVVAVMRHALAPGTGDPPNFALDDCTTQRNLDDRGRAQAREIGEALRSRGIVFDHVLTSQWCRTRETAELLNVGPVEDASALNSFFSDFASRDRQTRETLDLIARTEGRMLLVSHQVNISALTGRGTGSGEILSIQLTDGGVKVTGSVLIEP